LTFDWTLVCSFREVGSKVYVLSGRSSRAFRRVHKPETALIDLPFDVSLHADVQCDIERDLKPVA
jgi:hypothetical protein